MQSVQPHKGWRLAVALASVAGLTAVLLVLRELLAPIDLLLCYVPLVLIVAIRFGRTAAILASFASFLAYNFFFVQPLYTLTIEQPQEIAELAIFLVISLLAGTLAARERALKLGAIQRAEQMTALYRLSQEVNSVRDDAELLPTIASAARRVLDAQCVEICLSGHGNVPPLTVRAGRSDDFAPHITSIVSVAEPLGELRVYGIPMPTNADEMTSTLLTTIANHIALAVERSRTAAATWQTHSLREADRLKSALLSSVSHDLRTPLAVIKGAADNLLDTSVRWDAATQRAFAVTISQEANRLNRFVRNLLEMSRLEGVAARRPPTLTEISDVLGATLQRLAPLLANHVLHVEIAPDLPVVPMDPVQIELVLSNLLENAAKFAPPHTPIGVEVRQAGTELVVSVADRGPGIPASDLNRVFEKFYRLAGPEQGQGGTGLGLAICQGIVEAHGGHIWATNRQACGAVFSFTLPLEARPQAQPVEEQHA